MNYWDLDFGKVYIWHCQNKTNPKNRKPLKKKAQKDNPKQIRMEKAHQKNLYLKKLKSMMGIMGNELAYDLIDPLTIEKIFYLRIHPIKMKSRIYKNATISVKELDLINNNFTRLLNEEFINIGIDKTPVSVYNFYIYIETIYLLWRNADKINFPKAEKFKEMLPAFNDNFKKIREKAHALVEESANFIAWMFSNTMHRIFLMKHEKSEQHSNMMDNSACYNYFYIYIEKPETISLEIDNKKRNIYRVGSSIPLEGIIWLFTTPENLGMKGILNTLPLKIYIQQHAIERLKERLGEIFDNFHYFIISSAILSNEVHQSGDGSFMYAVKYLSIKVGYLKATIIEDKLLIRTFLFVTNNGTPEGKKLADLLGVQKEDKKYLGIDKLNTFINSDIEEDEKLKQIFCQIGCEGLFSLKKHLINEQDKIMHCANYFSQYLGLEKREEMIDIE